MLKINEEIVRRLGELIFNGTIIFLSVSFGLFALSLGSGNISTSGGFEFGFFVSLIIGSGIASLLFSFFGIRDGKIQLIYWSLVFFGVMVTILTFAYAQIYRDTIEYLSNLQIVGK